MTAQTEIPLVHAGFGTPERQNRWTVAFRVILAIPHFVWLMLYGIAAYVLVIVGWFAALVMGRLPGPIADFLSGYVAYALRVYAYVNLLHGTFPPFNGTKAYPVNVDIPVTRVGRLAVLFRLLLLIPAGLVMGLATEGLSVLLVFIWLIVLVAGAMPITIFGAVAAVLRFQARYYAYAVMLTAKYPGELLGDAPLSSVAPGLYGGPPAATPGAPGPQAPPVVPPYPGQADPTSSVTPPVAAPAPPPPPAGFATPPPITPTGYQPAPPAPMPSAGPPSSPPRVGRLVLSKGSKRLVATFVILGLVAYGVGVAVEVSVAHNGSALSSLVNAHDNLGSAITAAEGQRSSCSGSELQCAEAYQAQLSSAFADFAATVNAISFPGSDQAGATRLASDATRLSGLLDQASTAPDTVTYETEVQQAQNLANQFDADYTALASALV